MSEVEESFELLQDMIQRKPVDQEAIDNARARYEDAVTRKVAAERRAGTGG